MNYLDIQAPESTSFLKTNYFTDNSTNISTNNIYLEESYFNQFAYSLDQFDQDVLKLPSISSRNFIQDESEHLFPNDLQLPQECQAFESNSISKNNFVTDDLTNILSNQQYLEDNHSQNFIQHNDYEEVEKPFFSDQSQYSLQLPQVAENNSLYPSNQNCPKFINFSIKSNQKFQDVQIVLQFLYLKFEKQLTADQSQKILQFPINQYNQYLKLLKKLHILGYDIIAAINSQKTFNDVDIEANNLQTDEYIYFQSKISKIQIYNEYKHILSEDVKNQLDQIDSVKQISDSKKSHEKTTDQRQKNRKICEVIFELYVQRSSYKMLRQDNKKVKITDLTDIGFLSIKKKSLDDYWKNIRLGIEHGYFNTNPSFENKMDHIRKWLKDNKYFKLKPKIDNMEELTGKLVSKFNRKEEADAKIQAICSKL